VLERHHRDHENDEQRRHHDLRSVHLSAAGELPAVNAVGSLCASRQRDGTALESARASSPLKFLFPRSSQAATGHPAWVCVTTLGGGLVSGDAIDLSIDVKPQATLLLTTQASTKVFKGASSQKLAAKVAGTLVVLMDPVSCFTGASYSQHVDIDLLEGGSVIWLESVTSGRPAFEPPFSFDAYHSKIRITRNSKPILIDSISIDRAHGSIADRFSRRRGNSFDTLSTIFALGPNAQPLLTDLLAADLENDAMTTTAVAPSPLENEIGAGAMVRIAATSAEHAARETRTRLRNLPEILMMDPFAFRR
jgi:urease accessory protein